MSSAADDLPTKGVRSYLYKRRADHLHRGIDLPAPKGTPVYAALGGRVIEATNAWKQGFTGYGRVVVIAAQDGTFHLYAHLNAPMVSAGYGVAAGELIGYVGTSVFSRADHDDESGAPHLHFEVSATPYPKASEAPRIDPVAYLRSGRVHPLKRVQLGSSNTAPDAITQADTIPPPKEPRAAVPPFGQSSRLCPACGQRLSSNGGNANGDGNG